MPTELVALVMKEWDGACFVNESLTTQCVMRIRRDIARMSKDPPPGVHVEPVDDNITRIHAIALGPTGTTYEGGFFHFIMQCPPDYPFNPPRVRLMNTDEGRVRFSPILHESGVVFLSTLNTYPGPLWGSALDLANMLVSIQSMMSKNPLYMEPLFSTVMPEGELRSYSLPVQHETVRVPVCDAVEACLDGSSLCPPSLRQVMLMLFLVYYETYEQAVESNLELSATVMRYPLSSTTARYQY